MKLYCAKNKDTNKLLHYKFNDEVSVIAVWRNKKSATSYVNSKKLRSAFKVSEFLLQDFDLSRDWHKKSNINVFIHLLD